MKTKLTKEIEELKSFKEDLKNRQESILTKEKNLKELLKEEIILLSNALKSLLEEGEYEKVNEIINNTGLNSQTKFPPLRTLTKKQFEEIEVFAHKNLNKDVAKQILSDILEKGGSSTKFVILVNMYLRSKNLQETLSGKFVWEIREQFQGTHYLDTGLLLSGTDVNKEEAEYLIEQFKYLNAGLVEDRKLVNPIYIQLQELKLTKSGLIELTENSRFKIVNASNKFKFNEVDELGFPIESQDGKFTAYFNEQKGLLGCYFGTILGFYARNRNLVNSNPSGWVVSLNKKIA